MQRRSRIILYSFTTVCIMILIFVFSCQDGVQSKNMSEGFLTTMIGKLLDTILPRFSHLTGEISIRKYAHLFEYAMLGVSTMLLMGEVFIKKTFLPILSAEFICFLYACSDEWHQTFVPGRSGEFKDVGVDAIGFTVGIIIIALISLIINKRK